jgi:magnesium chelatase family protein
MNPCPCGNLGTRGKECICSAQAIEKYRRKLSGPIMDRIDMWVEVSRVDYEKLTEDRNLHEGTNKIKPRVIKARNIQEKRYKNLKIKTNSEISSKDLVTKLKLSESVKNILNESAKKLDLSARSYHRVIKLARTIADLDNSKEIKEGHVLESLQYRPKKY